MSVRTRGVAALVVWLAWACPGAAWQSVDYASLSGRVTDQSGAVIPDAGVTARHAGTNVTDATVTNEAGRFRFPYLRVGTYEIVVELAGFADFTRQLTLTAGSAFELPVTLVVAGVDTAITVSAETAVLEAARSQLAGTISQTEVENVPLNGRNVLELALLVPGVAPAQIPSTQQFPETSAVPGVSLSVGSARNLSNNFIVDGLSANDDAAALSGIAYGVDAVEQLQVVTAGGQAELGRALGGYLNIVTRSGTNRYRGSVYDYLRDDNFNARNGLSGDRQPMNQQQFGASLGGPLAVNRTFFFANIERKDLDQSGLVSVLPADVGIINARLAATGYPGPAISTGLYPNPIRSTTLMAKLDHVVSAAGRLNVRYSLYDVEAPNARGAGGLSAPTGSAGLDSLDQTVAFGNTLMLTDRLVLETRGQYAHSNLSALPTDRVGPTVTIAGVATFGPFASSPTARINDTSQILNNLSYQAGDHAWRAGVDFLDNDDTIGFLRQVRGAYTFSSMANFLSGTYNNAGFQQTFGATEVRQSNPNLGMYVQDEWKVNAGLTLNLGIRYDLQWLETINTDTDNVSPRVGFAWVPSGARTTIVRGSAGRFYDRVPLRALANALLSAGNTTDVGNLRQINISLSPAQPAAPAFPDILAAPVPLVTLVNLTTMDRDIQNAYSTQASVEIEQQIGQRATVSAAYQYSRGDRLIMSINQNVPTCLPAGANNGCRPNPNYANNSQYSSQGESEYHGLHLSYVHRPMRWGHVRVSYSLSDAKDNVGQFFFSAPVDPTNPDLDWGRSDNDQRHRLVINGAVHTSMAPAATTWQRISHGFQLSGMMQAYSAAPFNITSGVTTVQGTAGRPIVDGRFIPRNAGSGTPFFSLSARLSRVFTLSGRVDLEALIEAFNLTDRVNVVTRNMNFGAGAYPADPAATFNQITAVGEPRSLQFGIRLAF